MTVCNYKRDCPFADEDCFSNKYCGVKEDFMTLQELKKYRKKHGLPYKKNKKLVM